ncbi:MAG: efflux RND transporter periplasmic adaptor subunit [Gemmatimonadaceae bacterium]|nr:efflux RND transporter periplasmic adaptor subunit [Gemmatimonadaceae bacterium]
MLSRSRPLVAACLGAMLVGCREQPPADAYGNFEADDVAVAAQATGQLASFTVTEGERLDAGVVVATLDTAQQAIDRDQAIAQRAVLDAQRREATQQEQVIGVQLEIAERSWARTQRLFAGGAATVLQRDQAEREVRVLRTQREAARAMLERLRADARTIDLRGAAARDRLRRTTVINPVAGTVLATHVRAGETVAAGQPLYRIAALDTLTLRVYVTGPQLTAFRLGTTVAVHVDSASGLAPERRGTVTWVSPRAEFTPTPVQTRDERADLVYAVKIRVPNPDGLLKVGMPADVALTSPRVATRSGTGTP